MLPGGLIQMISQSVPTGWWPKEQVVDPHGRPLKLRAPFVQLLEFGNQLTHNLHVEGVIG
jgi:hypothetical protein